MALSMALTTFTLLSALTVVNATPIRARDLRSALPSSANEIEYKFQPLMDFDKDGCYNTAAIDSSGNTNPGLGPVFKSPSSDCRDGDRLQNNNVYSRKRCNNGWCAIMYEYYFEKDQTVWGSFGVGHRHDWENVVVFAQGDEVKWVAPSCHGKYDHATGSPRLDGVRPKVVYHQDGAGTHCIRMANEDDDNIENETGSWFTGALIGWDNWPDFNLRDTMLRAWSGGVGPKLDDEFASALAAAAGNNGYSVEQCWFGTGYKGLACHSTDSSSAPHMYIYSSSALGATPSKFLSITIEFQN
ncbi:hypothetical protein DL769_000135 [Monosporascus sp. CRB-8-3]|nr:hypothetical protein DL769_000135 [Monosporascus sp. CRB-8-3]